MAFSSRTGRRNLISTSALLTTIGAASLFAQAPQIYPEKADAHKEIAEALAKATAQHKRVLLDFGGNWCGDCRALNEYLHRAPNADLLKANFILVDVNIGRFDANLDIAKKYEVPLEKGVPAMAVLDADGHLAYSQKAGEFESMRRMSIGSVTDFLNKWKLNPAPANR